MIEDKNITLRVCENIVYLAEKKGIKHISSIESAIGLSRGYISRCMAHDNKKLSVDVVYKVADFFEVRVEELINCDLRGYEDMINENIVLLEGEEEAF